MDLTTIAAVVFAVAAAGVVAFQFALALGAPWGRYAMGGAMPGRFPPPMRVAAAVQGALVGILAFGVLSAAGLARPDLAVAFPWLIWVAVAVSALAVVLNAISSSAGERRIWVPVALVLLVSSLIVALIGDVGHDDRVVRVLPGRDYLFFPSAGEAGAHIQDPVGHKAWHGEYEVKDGTIRLYDASDGATNSSDFTSTPDGKHLKFYAKDFSWVSDTTNLRPAAAE